MSTLRDTAISEVRAELSELDLVWTESAPGLFSVRLPGTRKLITECALEVGQHGMSLRAFVARQPDENHAGVYRWLLERNLKLRGICFALDALGRHLPSWKDAGRSGHASRGRSTAGRRGRGRRRELQRDLGTGLRRKHQARVGLASLPRRVNRESCRIHPPGPGRESGKLIPVQRRRHVRH